MNTWWLCKHAALRPRFNWGNIPKRDCTRGITDEPIPINHFYLTSLAICLAATLRARTTSLRWDRSGNRWPRIRWSNRARIVYKCTLSKVNEGCFRCTMTRAMIGVVERARSEIWMPHKWSCQHFFLSCALYARIRERLVMAIFIDRCDDARKRVDGAHCLESHV